MNNLNSHTILLVEDEIIIGMSTKKKLESLGYNIILATNSKIAIELAKENIIDLVLMDIDLGNGINGIETCKTIIEKKYIPIIFVSSHTEREVVSLTEEITSYGYIVKSSHLTVYDASIKMAYKLYEEKKKRELFNQYLEFASNTKPNPFFITDLNGDIVFFNNAYLSIQGLDETKKSQLERNFSKLKEQIIVFDVNGKLLEPKDWASSRGIAGFKGTGVPIIVYHKSLQILLVNYYTYSPITSQDNEIIGSFVEITNAKIEDFATVNERIIKNFHLTTAST